MSISFAYERKNYAYKEATMTFDGSNYANVFLNNRNTYTLQLVQNNWCFRTIEFPNLREAIARAIELGYGEDIRL